MQYTQNVFLVQQFVLIKLITICCNKHSAQQIEQAYFWQSNTKKRDTHQISDYGFIIFDLVDIVLGS